MRKKHKNDLMESLLLRTISPIKGCIDKYSIQKTLDLYLRSMIVIEKI